MLRSRTPLLVLALTVLAAPLAAQITTRTNLAGNATRAWLEPRIATSAPSRITLPVGQVLVERTMLQGGGGDVVLAMAFVREGRLIWQSESKPFRLDPATTAVVTMELQRGVVGDLATHPDLVAAAAPVLPHVAEICRAARAAGAHVVHATVAFRADVPFATSSPIQWASARANAGVLAEGAPGVELAEAIGPSPGDVVAVRHTGMTPFTGRP